MQDKDAEKLKLDKVNVKNIPSTPHSINSTPTRSETETYSENRRFMSQAPESEDDSVSEVESFIVEPDYDDETKDSKFLLNSDGNRIDLETQAHIEELLQAAGISRPLTSTDSKALGDPDVLRQLTSSVSNALDEAAAALTRMRNDNAAAASNVQGDSNSGTYTTTSSEDDSVKSPNKMSLAEACSDGDVRTVKRLLKEGRSIHETTEEGESVLSLTCSAGYYEIVEILLAMQANVEDRGIKGDCTPLMEAATAGHLDIVKLLIHHRAEVNAQSTSGSTPLIFACAAGHTEIVKYLMEKGANLEDHNENGHTPLMEAASAGHVGCARALIEHGAGINTHSSEFKESALTLACYKGHLEMVRYLLEAGADQEHKTDEMHTALMEASMDGHVEVARLLLDSGAQVNMPTESFESPLTLAACGGHVDLAMLLIERGADIEEKNDEGYTPLMEASREGHEEMIHLLLGQGANVNGTTEESQETALTLACSAGFMEIVEILVKNGADVELGSATPLMEASQDGHIDVVKFLLEYGANVNACTETGDTALALACENGHTDVVELLLQSNADIEHESEGGRTPLMKACRAGHLCTVEFLIKKGANVRKQTTNNDHTPLSLACAGGHLSVVELLLKHNADPKHKLKDNSTMLIEASRGGHTNVVQLLLDYPHSMVLGNQHQQQTATAATSLSMLPGQVNNRDAPLTTGVITPTIATSGPFFQPSNEVLATAVLQEVPEAVRIVQQIEISNPPIEVSHKQQIQSTTLRSPNSEPSQHQQQKSNRKLLAKSRSTSAMFDGAITSSEVQQVRTPPLSDFEEEVIAASAAMEYLNKEDPNSSLINFIKRGKAFSNEGDSEKQKQQILEELHRVERELRSMQPTPPMPIIPITEDGRPHPLYQCQLPHSDQCVPTGTATALTPVLNFDLAIQQQKQGLTYAGVPPQSQTQIQVPFYAGTPLTSNTGQFTSQPNQAPACQTTAPAAYYFTPIPSSSPQIGVSITAATTHTGTVVTAPTSPGLNTLVPASSLTSQAIKFHSVADVSQNTAINDRPKVKPIKKEAKNIRKQQALQQITLQQQPQPQPSSNVNIQAIQTISQNQTQINTAQPKNFNNVFADQQVQLFTPIQLALQAQQQSQQQSRMTQNHFIEQFQKIDCNVSTEVVNMQDFDTTFLKDEQESILTAAIIQQFNNPSFLRANVGQKPRLEVYDPSQQELSSQNTVTKLHISDKDFIDEVEALQVQPYAATIDESVLASLTAAQQADLQAANGTVATEGNRLEYYAVPAATATTPNGTTTQVPVQTLFPYDHYIQGFQAGYSLKQQLLADSLTVAGSVAQPLTTQPINCLPSNPNQACVNIPQPQLIATCGHTTQGSHICQPCGQHQQQNIITQQIFQPQPQQVSNQVQAATQTQTQVNNDQVKKQKSSEVKVKKNRGGNRHTNSMKNNSQHDPNYQIDHNSAITQYSGANNRPCPNSVIPPPVELDCETESNHDTALTLACAGGHEELVELLINRGADIEHRDKKGFTPLILASSAGHDKVVIILLNNGADIEAQSERTKDTPLSLASSGGRYEVVELLLQRNANKEHRNVSDYTPLSLAASGGYVNIIKLLLNNGAEINSRTGSKLGISPLMLAAMNGHTAAVKSLLDCGSDINAQIETNRNTALTLACFQGRHEVVSLLLDRKANVEHRAKTGLTPLMEAASGGYVDVGKVLLEKGADVNATPVPSSRDTALTIASDKGHIRFVELLIQKGAQVEVKNKKGNSPMWLAANGGHLAVIELLFANKADIDSQDNRKVSCLMAAFRKGHIKVVKWMVHHVSQFPNDQEMLRFISTVNDKELLEKCKECVKIIRAAKETQAVRANENASILLEELATEKTREESKKIAAAKKRERKKRKRLEKKVQHQRLLEEENQPEEYEQTADQVEHEEKDEPEDNTTEESHQVNNYKEEGDSGIDANSQGSCSSSEIKQPNGKEKRKNRKNKKGNAATKTENLPTASSKPKASSSKVSAKLESRDKSDKGKLVKESKNQTKAANRKSNHNEKNKAASNETNTKSPADREDFEATGSELFIGISKNTKKSDENHTHQNQSSKTSTNFSPRQASKRDEGWKEVVRKSSVQPMSDSTFRKISVPLHAISRVIGRGGTNINAIRQHTGAVIEVEKQCKGQGERTITLKGAPEITKQAFALISTLVKDADADISSILSKTPKPPNTNTTLWDKTQSAAKKNAGKLPATSQPSNSSTLVHSKVSQPAVTPVIQSTVKFTNANTVKFRPTSSTVTTRVATPRIVPEKNIHVAQPQNIIRMPVSTASNSRPTKPTTTLSNMQTFAAKFNDVASLSQTSTSSSTLIKSRSTLGSSSTSNIMPCSISPQPITTAAVINIRNSPNKSVRPKPTGSAPPSVQLFQQNPPVSKPQHSPQPPPTIVNLFQSAGINVSTAPTATVSEHLSSAIGTTNKTSTVKSQIDEVRPVVQTTSEYTLFHCQGNYWNRHDEPVKLPNFAAVAGSGSSQAAAAAAAVSTQQKFIDQDPIPKVDERKAPGYRGVTVSSPVSSKTSSNSITPPNLSVNHMGFQALQEHTKPQNTLPPIGSRPQLPQTNANDFMSFIDYNKPVAMPNLMNLSNEQHLLQNTFNPIPNMNFPQPPQPPQLNLQQQQSATNMPRLNVSKPAEYPNSLYNSMQNKMTNNLYNGFQMQNNMYPMKNAIDVNNPYYSTTNMSNNPSVNNHTHNRSWRTVYPNNADLIGLAGMTIHNLQKVYSGDNLETGSDLSTIVNSSSNLSTNIANAQHGLHPDSARFGLEERKPPQPIGTERARKSYNTQIDQNWGLNDKPAKWGSSTLEYGGGSGAGSGGSIVGGGGGGIRNEGVAGGVPAGNVSGSSNGGLRPNNLYQDEPPLDFTRPPIMMDNFINNQGNFFNHNAPPLSNLRHDFMQDMPKWDLPSCDNARTINDLQDKQQHVSRYKIQSKQVPYETGWTNQWHK